MQLMAYLEIIVRSTIVYIVLLVALRLSGKRYAGQLSPHDFVMMLLVSNALQGAMVGADVSLVGGLLAASTMLALNVLIARLLLHHRRWGPILAGEPTLLVYNGRILQEQLEREGILFEELSAQLRGKGFESVEQVKLAVQECDGSISVIGFSNTPEHRLPPAKRFW